MSKARIYCNRIFDGTHESPKPQNGNHKLITSKNIIDGHIDDTDAYFISDADYNRIQTRSAVKQWDVLFSMIGTIGNVCIVRDKVVNYAIKNIGVFSCKNKDEAKWLYYYLKNPSLRKANERYVSGAVQKFLPLKYLRNIEVPDYTDDKKEAVELLWNIDTYVDTNNKTEVRLKSIIDFIYNYWFVQFDFPDENGRPYKSSDGKMVYNEQLKQEVPEGWKVSNLANTNLATVIKPGINNFIGEKTYLATGDVNGDNISNKAKSITYTNRESRANMQPTFNSVWFAKMKDSVKHIIITDSSSDLVSQCILSTGFCGLQANSITLCYLAAYISQPQFEQTKNMLAHGATQKAISNSDLSSVTILEPDDATLQKFAGIVYPMLELIDNCRQQSKQLASLRDWLLPMLMNGQVEIRDARDNSGSNLSDIN